MMTNNEPGRSQMNRRQFLVVLGSASAGLALSACLPTRESESDDGGPQSQDLLVWNFSTAFKPYIEGEFAAAHPELTVELVDIANPDLHERLLVSLATGTDLPDATMVVMNRAPEYLATGGLLDLTDAMEPYVDDLDPSALLQSDGRIFGWDVGGGEMAMWFNHEALMAVGIDIETFDTWDAVVEAGLKLRTDSGGEKFLFMQMGGNAGFQQYNAYYHSQGGQWWDEQGELIEDQQTAVDTLTWLVTQVNDNGIVMTGFTPYGDPLLWEAMEQEKLLGFGSNFTVGTGLLPTRVPDQAGKWRMITWPKWSDSAEQITGKYGGVALIGLDDARNPDAAKDFVTWWLSDEGLPLLVDSFGRVPSKRAAELDLFSGGYEYFGGQEVMKELSTVSYPPFNYKLWSRTSSILENALDRALLGEWEPAEAIDNAMTELRQL